MIDPAEASLLADQIAGKSSQWTGMCREIAYSCFRTHTYAIRQELLSLANDKHQQTAHETPRLSTEHRALPNDDQPRRRFLTVASGSALAGLLGAYGTFAYMLGEFVYPAEGNAKGWLFVCTVDHLAEGEALDFTSPTGAKVVVARQGAGTAEVDFLALSSVCPHLGCRVHWESQNDRFFCPCHNGAFDREGNPVSGPPQAAKQSLVRFPLKVENGLLFLEVPMESIASCPAEPLRTRDPHGEAIGPEADDSGVA